MQRGTNPGIYNTWPECQAQVHGFHGPKFRKFKTYQEAEDFVNNKQYTAPTPSCTPETVSSPYHVQSPRAAPVALSSASRQTTPRTPMKGTILLDTAPTQPGFSVQRNAHQAASTSTLSAAVYTDGCCLANGQSCAKGGIGVYWGDNDRRNVSRPLQGRATNNRAEITAAQVALEQAKEQGLKNLTINTDSKFMINAITKWIHKWKRNGWKLANGKDVVNKEDFLALDAAMQGINVEWNHVRGHRGIHGNEMADQLANQGALK